MKRIDSAVLSLVILTSLALSQAGCGSEKKGDPAAGRRDRPVPVSVSPVLQKTIPLEIAGIGNAEAYSSVSVKSRIGGELKKVHFREGQEVRQGDLLFSIDPQPYEAALKQAQANLARTSALAKKAEGRPISPEEYLQKLTEGTDTHRLTKEEDVAELVMFLASKASQNITGEIVNVAGGY
ncbi:MAG: SDR family oxidoreductase [Acidobacteria bacterium]|nr:SDR family oxidoreductase [Acidobacteriota bacterium]